MSAEIRRGRIFLIMTMALFTAAASVALRAVIAAHLRADFLDALDPGCASELLGTILGTAFAGFSITLFVASPLLPVLTMRRALMAAGLLLAGGLALMALAGAGGTGVFAVLALAMLLQGIGWGLVEAVINPLTSALYDADKTHRLNVLHAWYPGGIVAGSLIGLAADGAGLDWRWAALPVALLALGVFALALTERFPARETIGNGVSMGEMIRAVARQPTIFLWFLVMTMTATTEFAPGQWVDFALSEIVGMRGILLLVYVSALMFVMRHFAGPLVRRLSNVGLLFVCSIFAAGGLYGLSLAATPAGALLAATAWGVGICFCWPTMLATVAERYPQGGTLVYGLMGSAGAAATYLTLPVLGRVYDQAGGSAAPAAAASASFQAVALIPAALILVFGLILLADQRRARQAAARA